MARWRWAAFIHSTATSICWCWSSRHRTRSAAAPGRNKCCSCPAPRLRSNLRCCTAANTCRGAIPRRSAFTSLKAGATAIVPGTGRRCGWPDWNDTLDPDLAGALHRHPTPRRTPGRCADCERMPEVPWADYLDSILRDLTWACERADDNPVYLVLNTCRIWAAVADQLVSLQGGRSRLGASASSRRPGPLSQLLQRFMAANSGRAAGRIAGSEALRARWVAPYLA